jgi:hypothetical protein
MAATKPQARDTIATLRMNVSMVVPFPLHSGCAHPECRAVTGLPLRNY